MNRLNKYKESLQRFIKEKSCLFTNNISCKTCDGCVNNNTCINNSCSNCKPCIRCFDCKYCKQSKTSLYCENCMECKTCYNCDNCCKDINNYIYNLILANDSTYSILFLTIMNNQNKKNHLSLQGYYIATFIEFYNVLINIVENKNNIIQMFGVNKYIRMCNNLVIYGNKSWQQNIDSVKNIFLAQNLTNIIIHSMNVSNNVLKYIMELTDYKFDVTNNNCNFNIVEWYLKDNELIKKFKSLNQLSKNSMNNYIFKKYIGMCELAITLGWIFGNGNIKDVDTLKNTFKYFGMMCKLSVDFVNIDKDLNESNIYGTNYVLNYGLADAYDVFVNNKQLFITEMLSKEMYSSTIKEIIDKLEIEIENIIDQTSPDLKSNYSISNKN